MGRFLLIGLDGAEPSLVERWMDEGHLPSLASLRESGSYLPCASTNPPATFPAWTTCVTGVNPGRHGIIDFTHMEAGRYALRFVNATDRTAPAIWNTLTELGKRVCVLGVPATYPPDKINGLMISGIDSHVTTDVDQSFVHPASAYDEVRDWRLAEFQESDIGPGSYDTALERMLDAIATKERIALAQLEREAWDFFMIVFGESDTVSRHFWLFHDPDSPHHKPGGQDAIRKIYQRLDQAIGRLITAAGPDTCVGIVSVHGFGGAGTGVVHINNWLAENGHLAFTETGENQAREFALKLVPEKLRGRLFRRFQRWAGGVEGRSRFSGIDWPRTTAWSEELNSFPSIRVHVSGRDALGQVAPDKYDEFVAALCHELETWEVIQKAWRRDELFDGPHVERAPDIILELALEDGYSHSCIRSTGGPPFRRLEAYEYTGNEEHGMAGNHRSQGILFLSTPSNATNASILDIAPTVFGALGVEGPPMEGRNLGCFE